MVFAKTSKAASRLSDQVRTRGLKKTYQAVLCGRPQAASATWKDWLIKNEKTNTVRTAAPNTPKAKEAILSYQIQGEKEGLTLAEIQLETGRPHQIRVQFAAHGTPLVGDTKYGAPAAASVGRARREPLALCAVRLSFLHPVTGERMEFSTEPQFTL